MLSTACASGELIELARFDRAAVEVRYPSLRDRIVAGTDVPDRRPEPVGAERRWIDTPDQRLIPGALVRFRADEREFTVTVPAWSEQVDVAPAVQVRLTHRPIAEVRAEVVRKLGQTVRHPKVEIHVREDTLRRARPYRFAVVGMVKHPGEHGAKSPQSVSMAVARAGGAIYGALINQVLVVQPEGRVIVVDLLSFVSDPFVRDGDVIVVPKNHAASLSAAAEWESIAAFAEGRIDRRALIRRLAAR